MADAHTVADRCAERQDPPFLVCPSLQLPMMVMSSRGGNKVFPQLYCTSFRANMSPVFSTARPASQTAITAKIGAGRPLTAVPATPIIQLAAARLPEEP